MEWNNGYMRKWCVILVLLMIIILVQVTSVYTGSALNNPSVWLCERGDGSRACHCNSTIHFPFSVSWSTSIAQSHSVLVFDKYFAIIRAGEVLVYQDGTEDTLYSISVDSACVPCVFNGDLYSARGEELIATKLSNGSISYSIEMSFGKPEFLVPSEDFLLVVTSEKYILRIRDGIITGKHQLPDTVSTCPVVSKGVIAVACDDGDC